MFASIIMIIIGLLIIIACNKLCKPIDYSGWKEADGIVEEVRTSDFIDGELISTSAYLLVSFEINGKSVRGSSNMIGTEKDCTRVIAKYPKGTQVHFRYNDKKKTILSQIADDLNFNKHIYIDDKEFSRDARDKNFQMVTYGFGFAFLLLAAIKILTILI